MGLLRRQQRQGNGQEIILSPDKDLGQQPAKAPNAPDDIYTLLTETSDTRFIFPSDPVLDRMLIALGAEPIFGDEPFTRRGYNKDEFQFRVFIVPSSLHVEWSRPSRIDEGLPDGVTGAIPHLLRSSDGLVFAAIDTSLQKCEIQIGTSWQAIYAFFQTHNEVPPLPDLIANAGFTDAPLQPTERHLRLHVDGATYVGTMPHDSLATRELFSFDDRQKLGNAGLKKAFEAHVDQLRKPFEKIGTQRVALLERFMQDVPVDISPKPMTQAATPELPGNR